MPELLQPATLAELLAPMSAASFFSSHWERAPLHIARSRPEFYDLAFPAAPIARLAFELEPIGRVADENPDNVRGPVDVMGSPALRGAPRGVTLSKEARLAAYERGATLRLNDVHHRVEPVRVLSEALGAELGCVVGANLYVVRAGAPSTGLHVDPHDVYILQLRGRKRWQLFEGKQKMPIVAAPSFSFQRSAGARAAPAHYDHRPAEGLGPPIADVVLEQGDALYVPRGTFHLVSALDLDSMHLSFGTWPVTIVDWLSNALALAADRDARLRRALPPGLLRGGPGPESRELFADAAQAFAEAADADASLESLAAAFAKLAGLRRRDTPERAASIAPDARFERDPAAEATLDVTGPRARLAVAGHTVELPERYASALQRAMDGRAFRVDELPGDLPPRDRAQLVDRLVHVGALRPVQVSSAP